MIKSEILIITISEAQFSITNVSPIDNNREEFAVKYGGNIF